MEHFINVERNSNSFKNVSVAVDDEEGSEGPSNKFNEVSLSLPSSAPNFYNVYAILMGLSQVRIDEGNVVKFPRPDYGSVLFLHEDEPTGVFYALLSPLYNH